MEFIDGKGYMCRGDSEALTIELDGNLSKSGTLWFSVKKKLTDTDCVIEKSIPINTTDKIYQIDIDRQDTEDLSPGAYLFDITIVFSGTDKKTPVPVYEFESGKVRSIVIAERVNNQ